MNAGLALVAFAVLFAVFGLVRHRACTSDCSRCAQSCKPHSDAPPR